MSMLTIRYRSKPDAAHCRRSRFNEGGLYQALRSRARTGARLADYGRLYGFAPLRERVAEQPESRLWRFCAGSSSAIRHDMPG
jgi:hypothetical protein